MNNEEDMKLVAAQELHERARYYRGRFLNHVAVIEHELAKLLTEYFCTDDEDKQNLLFCKVAEKFSLEKKKTLLIEIVKNDYPIYWEKNKTFLNGLKEIQEFRNKLAHSIVDVSDEALMRPLEDGISFIQWKKGSPITDNGFQEYEVKANMVLSTLREIKQLLPFKEVPDT